MRFLPIAVVLWLAAFAASLVAGDHRPNIVLLLADDLRWDALGCAGNSIIQTPNIDRLAQRGVHFQNSFVTTSICSISRASLLTGQYESRHGIDDFAKQLPADAMVQTFPFLLKEAGYRIGFIGKWGVGDHGLPSVSFDYWRGFPGQGRYFEKSDGRHLTDQMGDQAIEFLEKNQSAPFFLQISFKAPHEQDGAKERFFPPAKRFESLYVEQVIPPPPTVTPEAFEQLPLFLRESEARKRFMRQFSNPELYQESVRDYYRLVSGVDDVVGRIVQRLEELGSGEETVIVFTSDNGFCLGDRGLQGKWFMYEQSIRVPLIIADPRLKTEAKSSPAMALNIDLAPTILDLANVAIPATMQGRSLALILRGQTPADWRTDFFYEHHFKHPGLPMSEGVRGERWKYVRYVDRAPIVEQLFDLSQDPLELTNLIGDAAHRDDLQTMRACWADLRKHAK